MSSGPTSSRQPKLVQSARMGHSKKVCAHSEDIGGSGGTPGLFLMAGLSTIYGPIPMRNAGSHAAARE